MKHFIQIHQSRAIMFGLMITMFALFTSCAPKYGCYGMTETRYTMQDECTQELTDNGILVDEAIASNR